jgi:cell division protein FtsL
MPKLTILLIIGVAVSAAFVVELRHRNRNLYSELQALHAKRDGLNVEWERLLLEEATWSQHRRIELTARTKLGMDLPSSRQIVVVPLQARPTP